MRRCCELALPGSFSHWYGPETVPLFPELMSRVQAFEVIFSLVKVETLPPQLSKRFQRLMRAEEPSLPPEMADRLLSHWAITYFTVGSP